MSLPHARSVRWLYSQLPQLEREGVLDAEASARLRAHYGDVGKGVGRTLPFVLVSVLAIALVGGGVVLLFAHNWPDLSREVRAAISLLPVLLAGLFAAWAVASRRGAVWREAAGLAVALAAGASLGLIEQTYQIGGSDAGFALRWWCLALPLVLLLRSVAGAAVAAVGVTWMTFAMRSDWEQTVWAIPFVLALVGFYLWQLRSRDRPYGTAFLGWVLAPTLVLTSAAVLAPVLRELWPIVLTSLFLAFVAWGAVGERVSGEEPTLVQRPFRVVGGLGLLGMLAVLSFADVWNEVRDLTRLEIDLESGIGLAVLAAVLVTLVVRLVRRGASVADRGADAPAALWQRYDEGLWFVLALAGVAVGHGLALGDAEDAAGWLISVVAMVLGGLLLWSGVRRDSLSRVNYAMAMLSSVVLVRFFDQDIDMVTRGVAFVVAGVAILAVNVRLLTRRRRLDELEAIESQYRPGGRSLEVAGEETPSAVQAARSDRPSGEGPDASNGDAS